MRNLIIGAIALALGCATAGQESKSQTVSAQEQAHQSLQAAADAQKRAADEQKKVEQDQEAVKEAQKDLANAQANLRGQRVKAQQAQQEARRLSEQAQRDAQEQQQQALDLQQQQAQQTRRLNDQRSQSWTREQNVEGRVVQANAQQLQVRTQDQGLMNLQITDSTAINLNGRSGSVDQIQPGSDVRASYQMIDGKAKALQIDVTSTQPDQNQQQPSR